MSSKDVEIRFKEFINSKYLTCNKKELQEFQDYGYIFYTKKGFVTRDGEFINIKVINMNLNVSNVISLCEDFAKKNYYKKIYCMSKRLYNEYDDKGLIVNCEGRDFYKSANVDDMWLVYIVE